MEKNMDPNIPDRSNGSYFCRLCLIEVNSEGVWAVHVAGKRHYRNLMKYPNGIALRQNDGIKNDSFEKPAKYRRYENDEWNGCPSEENEYYAHRNYIPEIKPQVIDYGHKKGLSDVILPSVSKTLDDVSVKKKKENPINEIFEDEKYEQLQKYFKEKISKVRSDGIDQNTWNSNKVKPQDTWKSNKAKPQDTWNSNKGKPLNTGNSNKGKPQDIRNSNKAKPHVKESSYKDDFEKELDELLKDSSDNPESDEESFSNDNFKRKAEDLFSGSTSKRERKDKELKIPRIDDNVKDNLKVSSKTKIRDDSTSAKKRDDKDKMKNDRESFKKKTRKTTDDDDFVDIFHKMNDEKLFEMSAAEEDEDIYAVKKSSKTENPKLDDIDPDKLTTDLVDNLLSSYLRTKADSSKNKDTLESCTKDSLETNTKEDDPDTFSRKLESLPTKTFFQIILARLKTLDLKDSDELQMVLEVISQAQEVVCKKLPPHLQAVIKAKMSQNNSTKTTPISVQYPVLPKTESVGTTFPVVSKIVSMPTVSTISTPTLKSVPQSMSQEVKSMSQPVSSMSSQSVQTPVSSTASLSKISPFLSNLDSFQSMIAWQNYLTSKGTTSEKLALKSANAVQATLAYQNYLSKLQANAMTAKTTSESTASLNSCSTSKASLSSSLNSTQSTTQTVSESVGKLLSISKSAYTKDTLRNLFSTLQSTGSKTVSQTSSSSLTKSAPTLDSSQNQSTSKNSKYGSQRDRQTVSSTAEIPSNTVSYQNQTTAQNYQAYYQQYAMHLQRMSGQHANVGSSLSASLSALSQNLAVSQSKSSLSPYSHSNSTK